MSSVLFNKGGEFGISEVWGRNAKDARGQLLLPFSRYVCIISAYLIRYVAKLIFLENQIRLLRYI